MMPFRVVICGFQPFESPVVRLPASTPAAIDGEQILPKPPTVPLSNRTIALSLRGGSFRGWLNAVTDNTTCAIVGGGPAGMMLGLILARCGVDVTVLEKHADFLRDFRGDTVHPSTMRLLDELGLL